MEWNRFTKLKGEFGISDLPLYDLQQEGTSRLFGKGLGGIKVTDSKGKNINKKEISNFSKAIIKLISGVAFLVLITGIFTDLYTFWYGVIGFFALGIIGSSLKSLFGIRNVDVKGNLNFGKTNNSSSDKK